MSIKKTIGGDRLGSGKKMQVELKTYERSTHDLSYIWRSTMAAGTLVPFMTELGLPGDTFDIDLDCDIKTHPTIGPLFGTYKVQLDVFVTPIRLYQAQLHNNKLGIGMEMSQIKLPQILVVADNYDKTKSPDNQQINPSCILSYLNIRGVGESLVDEEAFRYFNALPYLMYWDIYKNYYANKQEEVGAVIHNQGSQLITTITSISLLRTSGGTPTTIGKAPLTGSYAVEYTDNQMNINYTAGQPQPDPKQVMIYTNLGQFTADQLWGNIDTTTAGVIKMGYSIMGSGYTIFNWDYIDGTTLIEQYPEVVTFPLANIDETREYILTVPQNQIVNITQTWSEPYNLPLKKEGAFWSKMTSQEGLALKTYQSDMFNNWMQTEWLDGDNGINEITAIDTSGGSFQIDTLILAKKVYNMMNRIAISGGSYDDWLDAVYTTERYRKVSTPMYMGGLSKELVFQEVVSNAAATKADVSQPLGTLAGKGAMGKKHKGGKVTIKIDEPSYITGIISLTPRIDYSQGNKWDTNIKTMDDFHKPGLDEIGYQDLITDQMAWWDTTIGVGGIPNFKSAGKQPAWLNYMTNVNQVRGNFAIEDNEMFMTLNRRYEQDEITGRIKDLTTYIDPMKFNHIFAETARDAQNFWAQISVGIEARRKMSAKIMPNL